MQARQDEAHGEQDGAIMDHLAQRPKELRSTCRDGGGRLQVRASGERRMWHAAAALTSCRHAAAPSNVEQVRECEREGYRQQRVEAYNRQLDVIPEVGPIGTVALTAKFKYLVPHVRKRR